MTTGVTGPTRAAVYRLLGSGPVSKKRCKSAKELRKPADRQPDDVQVVAIDTRHEGAAATLDGIAAGPPAPFARGHVPVDHGLLERVERDAGDLGGAARLAAAQARGRA